MTLWQQRLGVEPAPEMMAFSVSIAFDVRLAADDIAGSRAHVRGLRRAGLLDDAEARDVLGALDVVEQEITGGSFSFTPSDEDVHTAVERRVQELTGAAGAKLHTGRSRNDQVVTALRRWCRRELGEVAHGVLGLQRVLVRRATEELESGTYLPGYTHLQRAQPVLLAHHLLAHAWSLVRDVDRLVDARRRADVSPLGAGALAGSSLPLDPRSTAADLGFAGAFENSLDAVSDRDFAAEALFTLALLGVHLSRLGEEVVLWSSAEFGFLRLHDAWATGSSMLPQKKNPDVAELARGKAGRLLGNLIGLMVALKGLPLAYNRDLQEDKEPLFDSVDQSKLALAALTGLLDTASFSRETMAAAADGAEGSGVDLAEWLVVQGVPFRQAHGIVASVFREADAGGASVAALVAADPRLGPDAAALLAPGSAVTRRTTPGGAGPDPVAAQLERLTARLAADEERLA